MSTPRPSAIRRVVAGLSAAWLLAGAGVALAQDQEKEKPAPPPPLQGPKVNTNRPPELEDRFIPGGGGRNREAALRMPAYLEVIGKLRADETPAELRLTEEQESQIKQIDADFRRAQREAAAGARPQRPNRRPAETDAKPGDAKPAEGDGSMMDEAMQRDREARRRNAPSAMEYQGRIWAILSEPQQGFIKGELEKARDEADKRRNEEYMRREMERIRRENEARAMPESARPEAPQRPGDGTPQALSDRQIRTMDQATAAREMVSRRVWSQRTEIDAETKKRLDDEVAKLRARVEQLRSGDAAPRPGPGAGAPPEMRERVQRIFERLRQMDPEERERFLRRIEEELDRRAAARGEGEPMDKDAGEGSTPPRRPARPNRPNRRNPGGGEDRPPPPMEEVEVPAPEKPVKK